MCTRALIYNFMNVIAKLKNYWNKETVHYYYKDYIILLKSFTLDDDRLYTSKIFRQLKGSGVSIVASNGDSNNWHFIISFHQKNHSDQSTIVHAIMAPVLQQFNLEIKSVGPDEAQK